MLYVANLSNFRAILGRLVVRGRMAITKRLSTDHNVVIPFVNQHLDLTSWADCLRAWPNPPEGWVPWYNRVSKTHYATWESIGIADALSLSLSPLEKNENILKTIGYFWSDALNCFMFGHGPMTPTLLDVAMITGLDIASPSPSAFKLPRVPFTLSSKKECTSWGAYLNQPNCLTSLLAKGATPSLMLWPFQSLTTSFTTDGFETWWSMWKTHVFRRALGPLLKQLDAAHDISADQQQDGPAPMQADGSPFVFLPPAPVVLFCQSSPPLKKVIMQGQPISPKSAPKSKASLGPVAPRASTQARTAVRKVAVRKTLTRRAPAQALSQINETSSGVVEEVPMPSTAPGPSNSPRVTDQVSDQRTAKPIVTTSASLPFLGEGCDPSSLLTFDPDSIEPAAPKIGEEPNLGAVDGPLQRLKVLLSSPVDTLVEDPETIRGILVDIQPRLPVVLEAKLWPTATLSVFKSRVQSARQRITLRRAQLPLRADIAEKCQRLNEKKDALDAKTATSTHSVRLETLRKELEDLKKRARETKRLIQDEESLIARSQEEVSLLI
ncbi:hypothetical protein QYE76_064924 [Lolium multiflorum]|uniref:Aminotransferase-like plant mobile domain-containing protein n=1 Tax=Lolium multiflorum TaxID=4521 RepID=A0AAD8WAF6_LOLMU|nr:hypothetical protein QYE76_064924 [Lolium multiflorum]